MSVTVDELARFLERFAPQDLAEDWDNTGLLTGNAQWDCSGVLCTLDVTVDVIREAVAKGCNLIIAHHPIIFKGLKRLTGKTYV